MENGNVCVILFPVDTETCRVFYYTMKSEKNVPTTKLWYIFGDHQYAKPDYANFCPIQNQMNSLTILCFSPELFHFTIKIA